MKRSKEKPVSRVIIADDDPVIRKWLTSILENDGYEVVTLEDGRAVYRLLQSDADFQGAVLDLEMPFLDGPDLIRHMRTEKRLMRIPVLMITAASQIQLLANGLAAGATVLLPKPFTRQRLQSTLQMMLGPVHGRQDSRPTIVRRDVVPAPMLPERMVTSIPGVASSAGDQGVNLGVLVDLDTGNESDSSLIAELIDLYLENADREVGQIRKAATEKSWSSIKKSAHALKGSSSTIGVSGVAGICEQLERSADPVSESMVTELISALEVALASAREILLGERWRRLQPVAA